MSEYIRYETFLFFQSLGLGVFLILSYDLLCALRKVVNHSAAVLAAEDLIYWSGTGIVIFVCVYRENQGIIRSFLVLGILLGAIVYRFTIGPAVLTGITKILEIPVFFAKKAIKRLLFLGRRGKILMYKIAVPVRKTKEDKAARKKRSKQVEKGKKDKKKKNRI